MSLPRTNDSRRAQTGRCSTPTTALFFVLFGASSIATTTALGAGETSVKGEKSLFPLRERPSSLGKATDLLPRAGAGAWGERTAGGEAVHPLKRGRVEGVEGPGKGAKYGAPLPAGRGAGLEKTALKRDIKSGMAVKTYEHLFSGRADWLAGATLPASGAPVAGDGGGAGGSACDNCVIGAIACDGTVDGVLGPGDCLLQDDTLFDIWTLEIKEPSHLAIRLTAEFNTFLFFVDAGCFVLALNNNCVPGDDFSGSCIEIDVPPGLYHLVPNGWLPPDAGPYRLSVACSEIVICENCLDGPIACGQTVDSVLELPPGDCDRGDGTGLDIWTFSLEQPGRVTIDMVSAVFDTYLFLYGTEDCLAFAADDDSGADLNSHLVVDLPAGSYAIGANSFAPADGPYTLTLACDTGFNYCADCVVGPLACAETVQGALSKDDCPLAVDGSFVDLHSFTVTATGRYVVTMTTAEFDPSLIVYDEACRVLATNDDCAPGDFTTACVTVDLFPGAYVIGANSFSPGEVGNYNLRVECRPGFDLCADCVAREIDCDSTLDGILDDQSCTIAGRGSFVHLYPFTLAQDGPVVIELNSSQFDPFVWLYDAGCAVVAFNDDSGPGLNSLLVRDLPAGSYAIGASTFAPAEIGAYDLRLSCPDVRLCRDCTVGPATCGSAINGSLSAADCALGDGSSVDLYSLTVEVTSVLDVDLQSGGFDANLFLLDRFCRVIARNDDCEAGVLDSCLDNVVVTPGDYWIAANSFAPGESGNYSLRVECEAFNPCDHCLAGSMVCGDTVSGEITRDDCPLGDNTFVDVWELTVDEPSVVTVEYESFEFDPFLFVLDADCVQVAANDDCDAGNINRSCVSPWVAAGTYYIVCNTVAAGAVGLYDLRVTCRPVEQVCADCEVSIVGCDDSVQGAFPTSAGCFSPRGPGLDTYSFVLPEDDLVTVAILGDFDTYLHLFDGNCQPIAEDDDSGPGINSLLTRNLSAGTYFAGVSSFLPGQGGGFTLSVTCGEVTFEAICRDCVVGSVGCGGAANGLFPQSECTGPRGTTIDAYRFELAREATVTLNLTGEYDTFLHLFNANCAQIAADDDSGVGLNSRIVIDLEAGTYFAGVSGFGAGQGGSFSLTATCESAGIGPFLRGDADGNRRLELTDSVSIFNFLFLGGPAPGCMAAADASRQGQVNLTSGVYGLNFLFLGGPPPPEPYPDCGPSDNAGDMTLGCLTPHACP